MDDEQRFALQVISAAARRPLKWCRDPQADYERELQLVLAELQAGQETLTKAFEALAKRVGQLAARLDGQQRYGSPTTDLKNETPQQREQRLREHRLRNSPNCPSSMFRR